MYMCLTSAALSVYSIRAYNLSSYGLLHQFRLAFARRQLSRRARCDSQGSKHWLVNHRLDGILFRFIVGH